MGDVGDPQDRTSEPEAGVTPSSLPPEPSTAADAGGTSSSNRPEGPEDKEDSEDPVVQECDVYLNRMYDPPDFVGDLYLLQYPLRPLYRPYGDQGELDRVELKPKSRRLKFVYKLQRGDNYDEDSVVHERQGQKHVLTSAIVANPSCSYAMCVIHQGRMTVTPIRAVNQLRPDFEAFDKARAQQKVACDAPLEAGADPVAAALAAADAAGGGSSDSGPEDSGAAASSALVEASEAMVAGAAVRVEYLPAGGGAGASGASSGVGPWGSSAAGQEDPWTRLDHYRARSDEAMDIHQRHIVWPAAAAADAEAEGREPEHPKLQALQLDGNRASFLARMCGQAAPGRERPRQVEEPQDGLSLYVLSRMPAERQVEAVVRHFGVVSYSRQLRKRLPPSTLRSQGPSGLLTMLQGVAVLVAGNWVLKSSLAGFEGAEADAREMLLCLLAKKDGRLQDVEYQKWDDIFSKVVHTSARREMALSVADHDQGEWKLKNPPDEDFKRKFPELVKEKMEWWETHRQGLIRRIQGLPKTRGPAASASAGSAVRQRSRLVGEVRAVLTLGAKTLPELRRALQKNNPTVAIHENDLLQALQQKDCDAVQVRELWMLARTGHEENDAFRSALVTLFRQRDSVSKAEILAEYERLSGKPCTLSHFLVRQLIREIAEKADRDNYVLKGTLLQSVQGSSAN